MQRPSGRCILVLVSLAGLLNGAGVAQSNPLPPPAERQVDFSKDIEPILGSRCLLCHGASQQMKGLRLDNRQDALRGGESGKVILPGDSAASKLIHLVGAVNPDRVMPPAGNRLTAAEVGTLRAWIDQGAEWALDDPAAAKQTTVAEESGHWSFRPLRRPPRPSVGKNGWAQNAIDSFVLARLEKEGIEPSPEADKATLIRRLSLDLIGLPPSATEVTSFLKDDRPEAYEHLVDQLLNSPHYGERWARYWLDLARYSDSDGYRQDDFRPHAWRYRHWVIEAFNRDMPFDQFTIEQIAGDVLPGSTTEQKVATGFHRNTPSNREGGTDMNQFRFEQVINRTNAVGTVWLGLTAGCAQCHDHKFDPLSQKEYYQLFAFFNDAEETNIDAPLPGELGPYLQEADPYRRKRLALLEKYRVPDRQPFWEKKMLEAMANPGKWQNWDKAAGTLRVGDMHPVYGMGEKILRSPPARRSEKEAKILTDHYVRYSSQVVPKKVYEEELNFDQLLEELKALDAAFPALSQAQTIATEKKPRQTHLYVRGNFKNLGAPVEPGMPGFLHPSPDRPQPPRLRLAKWIVSEDNPLTSRVVTNRFWQELFGRGIVSTSEDFGTQGSKPSHPELLDWLAAEFRDTGWSMKHLVKTIVLSATYRQVSRPRPDLQVRDPNNVLLASQSRTRLSAELIWDSALAVSGLLNPAVGGKSVRPPRPKAVQKRGSWVESTGPDRYRRGLYIQYQRMSPYPFMTNFDMPPGYTPACHRGRSNTPLQALNLLNDPVFYEAARALAVRILTESSEDSQDRLNHAFQLCLARTPDREELQWLGEAIQQQTEILKKEPDLAHATLSFELPGIKPIDAAAWVGASRVLLNLDEFITRE
jgi:hypothetical protein